MRPGSHKPKVLYNWVVKAAQNTLKAKQVKKHFQRFVDIL